MSKLIVVCGLPGSGKTTLAKALSKRLNIACLHKDSLKENLFEILQLTTLEDSKRIGAQSFELLMRLTEEQIANGADLVIESPFTFSDDYSTFQKWINAYNVNVYAVICSISYEERRRRFLTRDRHHSHHDGERFAANPSMFEGDRGVHENMPGKKIRIITDQPTHISVEKVIEEIGIVALTKNC